MISTGSNLQLPIFKLSVQQFQCQFSWGEYAITGLITNKSNYHIGFLSEILMPKGLAFAQIFGGTESGSSPRWKKLTSGYHY